MTQDALVESFEIVNREMKSQFENFLLNQCLESSHGQII